MSKWFARRLALLLIGCLLIAGLPAVADDAQPAAPEIDAQPEEAYAADAGEAIDSDDAGVFVDDDEDGLGICIEEIDPEVFGALDAGEDTGLTIDAGETDLAELLPDAAGEAGADAPTGLCEGEEYGDTQLMGAAQAQVGYVAIAAGTIVYSDVDMTARLGAFMQDGTAFAEAVEVGGTVLRVRFDTRAAREWAMEIPTGYVAVQDTLALTEAEAAEVVSALGSDTHTRSAGGNPIPCAAFDAGEGTPADPDADASELGAAYRTQAQVQAFVDAHPAYRYQINIYSAAGTDAPYSTGRLSAVNQQSALNMVNQMRYIAGIDADLTALTAQEEMMAATALVLRLNNKLSHYPERPAALADAAYDALFNMAQTGAGSANIAMGYTATSAILPFMADSDAGNIAAVGHRRWILNPRMGRTIFGASGRFSAMYAHDLTGSGRQTGVAWPGREMPIQYFSANDPWSVSLGRTLDAGAVEVDLVRMSDGRAWHFSAGGSDGFFAVENSYYGLTGCVIFRPDSLGGIGVDERFNVSVTDGASGKIIRYTVHFFELDLSRSQPLDDVAASAARRADGVRVSWSGVSGAAGYYVCRREGEGNYEIVADTSATEYLDKTAAEGADYTYQVYAHNASITSRSATGVQPELLLARSVSMNRSGTVKLYSNCTLQLTAGVEPENAFTALTWKSSNKKVAKVDANGLVRPVKKGTAYISVTTDNGKKASIKLKVLNPPKPKKVKLNKKGTVKLSLYSKLRLSAKLSPAHAAARLTWKSSSRRIATVSKKGVVTPKKEGTVTITVRTSNGKSARVRVRVYDPYKPKKVALSKKGTIVLLKGEKLKLDAILTPANARTKLKWTSSNKKVARVASDGTVTAKKKGKATITVRTKNGKKAKVKIKVI